MTARVRTLLFVIANLVGAAVLAFVARTPLPPPSLEVRYPEPGRALVILGEERETVAVSALEESALFGRGAEIARTGVDPDPPGGRVATRFDRGLFLRGLAIVFAASALVLLRLPLWWAHLRRTMRGPGR